MQTYTWYMADDGIMRSFSIVDLRAKVISNWSKFRNRDKCHVFDSDGNYVGTIYRLPTGKFDYLSGNGSIYRLNVDGTLGRRY